MDTEALVVDAFSQLGIEAELPEDLPGGGIDLILDPQGLRSEIHIQQRSLVTDEVADRLLAEWLTTDKTLLVVADRVTAGARKTLTARRGGYLDLRGRLAIRTENLLIDAEVPAVGTRPGRTEALSGKAGLQIAVALLMRPERPAAVRELARELNRSPSTVSEVLAHLRRDGLIDTANRVTGTDLFWQLADRWKGQRTLLATPPDQADTALAAPLRLGLEDAEHQPGWALSDSAAAAAYGAPVAIRTGQTLDFFVPDQATLRRAATLLGVADTTQQTRATVRLAPVPAVTGHRVELASNAVEWPLAHPLFVALDLAQDAGRGREILATWTPDQRWSRVW